MTKFVVILGRLVHEKARVVVEADSLKDLQGRLGEVYQKTFDTGDLTWESDGYVGDKEGIHYISSGKPLPGEKADFDIRSAEGYGRDDSEYGGY